MDRFAVAANESHVLEDSHLVEELKHSSNQHGDMFPLLVGESEIAYFHDVDGGYSPKQDAHFVNFIHQVQGPDSPSNKLQADSYEAHLSDKFYYLNATSSAILGDYPEENLVLSIEVRDYMIGRHSFSEALTAEIDSREEEWQPNYKK